ncbi:MAG: ATP-binding protein, partial [Hungatella sp.]
DADARTIFLYYSPIQNCIYIMDNGTGMEERIIRKHWMTIGNSSKKSTYITARQRIQTGAKGIGRFALDRISDHCHMLTISEAGSLEWVVDWRDFDDTRNLSDVKAKLYDSDETLLSFVEIAAWPNRQMAQWLSGEWEEFGKTGTVFCLKDLRDEWNEKTVEKIRTHLENLLPPDVVEDFTIYLFSDETKASAAKILSSHIYSSDYQIRFRVRDDMLYTSIWRNEFDFGLEEEMILQAVKFDAEEQPYFHGTPKKIQLPIASIGAPNSSGNLIGNFDGILYFNKNSVTEQDQKKFYYKDSVGRRNLTKDFGGVKIYRDHFRVRPYGDYGDNDFDWLELSARRNRQPAGLGHKNGRWRVSADQLVGIINISRENKNLEDAANRNGIQDGAGFNQLKAILLAVIDEFERDRQFVGRKLAEYAKEKDQLQEELQRLHQMAEERRRWEEERQQKKNSEQNRDSQENFDSDAPMVDPNYAEGIIKSLEQKQDQEIQDLLDEIKMLQTLATTGIITNMFMHEMRTLTNTIGQELDSAYESIVYDKDPDSALENIQNAIECKKNFASWFGVTIDSIKKDKRKRKNHNIMQLLQSFLSIWKSILIKQGITLTDTYEPFQDNAIEFRCYAFDVENVISNLISNSLYSFDREQEEKLEKKEIRIHITQEDGGFVIDYSDTGWGLSDQYKKRPEIILEAFETDKCGMLPAEEGTGMGMWIINKTILEYNGSIDLSKNKTLQIGFAVLLKFGGSDV